MWNTSTYSIDYTCEVCLQLYAIRPIIDKMIYASSLQIEDANFNSIFFLHREIENDFT